MAGRLSKAVVVAAAVQMVVGSAGGARSDSGTCAVPGVDDRCEAWIAGYNGPAKGGRGEDIGRAVAVAADGTVFTAGLSNNGPTGYDATLLAYTAAGAQKWAQVVVGPGYDTFSGVAVSPDGGTVFATGRHDGPGGDLDWRTVAFDASTGTKRWTATHRGADGIGEGSYAVATSPDGAVVYVGGFASDEGEEDGNVDFAVAAYDVATGALHWIRFYDGPGRGFDIAYAIEVGPDGTVFAAGSSDGHGTSDDAVVVALAPDGTTRWVARHDHRGGIDEATSLALAPGRGTVAVTGTMGARVSGRSLTDGDVVTVAYDTATGASRWVAVAQGSRAGHDSAGGVAAAANGGRFFVSAALAESPTHWEIATIAYDAASGTAVWSQLLPAPGTVDSATGIAVTGDGERVVTTGYGVVPRGEIQPVFKIEPRQMLTVAYDPLTGTRQWSARQDRSMRGADVAVGLTAAPTGRRVYAVGTFAETGVYAYPVEAGGAYSYDIATVAYDA